MLAMTSVRMPDDLADRREKVAARLTRAKGWIINDALRETLSTGQRPVDAKTLRRILREELKKAG